MQEIHDWHELDYIAPYVRKVKLIRHDVLDTYICNETDNLMLYILKGSFIHTVDDYTVELSEGMIRIIPPYANQVIDAVTSGYVDIYCIYFDLFDCSESRVAKFRQHDRRIAAREMFFSQHHTLAILEKSQRADFVERLSFMEKCYKSEPSLERNLTLKGCMLLTLRDFFCAKPLNQRTLKSNISPHVSEALRYADHNYEDPSLSVAEIAAHLGISIAHLSRIFKRDIGQPLSDYIMALRIKNAKDLFALGKRVTSVARSCGFLSLQTFARTFRRLEGCSPSEYLRRLRDGTKSHAQLKRQQVHLRCNPAHQLEAGMYRFYISHGTLEKKASQHLPPERNIIMTYRENYERWLASDKVDEATKAELRAIADNDEEIKFRFVKGLEFGTGGLRGTMVAGTNAMNVYTVAHATQGLADLINKEGKAERGVAIAHDSRNNSTLFAETAASVLAANGVKVKIFDGVRPTPVLSFAVRELSTIAGINITASHNPKQYNGYKAYWEDGAQLPPDHAKTVSEFIAAADIFDDVKLMDFDEGVKSGIIEFIPDDFDEIYIKNVLAEAVNPEVVAKVADDLEIVYTPLHGAGYRLVPEVLRRLGIKHIDTVDEQMVLDGNFPTTAFPNPEYPEVFTLGIKLAEKVGSDLIIATDPDADRVGIMSRDKSGAFKCLTGNQVGALLLDYIITAYEETGMPENPYAVKTIVTSEMCTKICADHNIKLHNVLTGFKFIGEVIKKYEVTGHDNYIFGFEESYGYLKGTYARDKDSVVASMLLCEMAAYYKMKNMTLCDAMDALYERYGCYFEGAGNIYMEGLDGIEKMKAPMNRLRSNPPADLAGYRVIERRDYLNDTVLDVDTGKVTSTGLPTSNVLYFKTEANDVIVIRPSGTEPKIKIYILVNGKDMDEVNAKIAAYDKVTETWVE